MSDDVIIRTNRLISVRYQTDEPWIHKRTNRRDQHGQIFSTKCGILLNLKEWHHLKHSRKSINRIRKSHIKMGNVIRLMIDGWQQFYRKNDNYRTRLTCCVCMNYEVKRVFLPCRHLVCCNTCSSNVRYCPYCRAFIIGTMLVFIWINLKNQIICALI